MCRNSRTPRASIWNVLGFLGSLDRHMPRPLIRRKRRKRQLLRSRLASGSQGARRVRKSQRNLFLLSPKSLQNRRTWLRNGFRAWDGRRRPRFASILKLLLFSLVWQRIARRKRRRQPRNSRRFHSISNRYCNSKERRASARRFFLCWPNRLMKNRRHVVMLMEGSRIYLPLARAEVTAIAYGGSGRRSSNGVMFMQRYD